MSSIRAKFYEPSDVPMLIRQNAGPIALGITLPAWMTSLFVQAEPVLHDLALMATITSGTFAAIWYWRQLHK